MLNKESLAAAFAYLESFVFFFRHQQIRDIGYLNIFGFFWNRFVRERFLNQFFLIAENGYKEAKAPWDYNGWQQEICQEAYERALAGP
jgi:hypothetical protein